MLGRSTSARTATGSCRNGDAPRSFPFARSRTSSCVPLAAMRTASNTPASRIEEQSQGRRGGGLSPPASRRRAARVQRRGGVFEPLGLAGEGRFGIDAEQQQVEPRDAAVANISAGEAGDEVAALEQRVVVGL